MSDELRPDATAAVQRLTGEAGLRLTSEDTNCVVDDLGDERAEVLIGQSREADAVSDEIVVELVDGIVSCVGTERLGATALAAQAPNASEESISCAAAALDPDLFKRLVLDRFVPQQTAGPALDLDVGVALATCLTPEELLDVSG